MVNVKQHLLCQTNLTGVFFAFFMFPNLSRYFLKESIFWPCAEDDGERKDDKTMQETMMMNVREEFPRGFIKSVKWLFRIGEGTKTRPIFQAGFVPYYLVEKQGEMKIKICPRKCDQCNQCQAIVLFSSETKERLPGHGFDTTVKYQREKSYFFYTKYSLRPEMELAAL